MAESCTHNQYSFSVVPGALSPFCAMSAPSTPQRELEQSRLYPASPFQAPLFIDPSFTDDSSNGLLASSSSPPDISSQSSLSPYAFSTDFEPSDYQQLRDLSTDWDFQGLTTLDDSTAEPTDVSSPEKARSKGKDQERTESPEKSEVPSSKSQVKRASNSWMIFRSEVVNSLKTGGNEQISAAAKEMRRLQLKYFEEHPEGLNELGMDPGSPDACEGDGSFQQGSFGGKGKAKSKFGGCVQVGGKNYNLPSPEFLISILDTLENGPNDDKLAQMDMSKFFSFQWKVLMSDKEKQVFVKMAQVAKAEHKAAHPDYKYTPQRRADKLREAEERRRQKEEAKREKVEAKKQLKREKQAAGKPTRTNRARARHSPISPSNKKTRRRTVRPHKFARSLSYTGLGERSADRQGHPLGLAADSFFLATEPGYMPAYPSSCDEPQLNRVSSIDLSAFAFPLPAGALPALATSEQNDQSGSNPVTISAGYQSWEPYPADSLSNPTYQHQPTYATYVAPQPPYTSPVLSQSPPDPNFLVHPSLLQADPRISPAISEVQTFTPLALDGNSNNFDLDMASQQLWPPQSQMPFDMFQLTEPLPIPAVSSIEMLSTVDSFDAPQARLSAVIDTINRYDFDVGYSASSRGAVLKQFNSWVDEQDELSTGTASATNLNPSTQSTGVPSTPAQELSVPIFDATSVPLAHSRFDPFASIFVEEVEDEPLRAGSVPLLPLAPIFEPDVGFLAMDASLYASDDNVTQDTQTSVPIDEGPFLSQHQPLSPTDSWTTGLTPLQATFFRAGQATQNRLTSSSSGTGTVRTASSAHGAPRYISASAFPRTPDSGDKPIQSGGERTTSLASLAAVFGADILHQPDDIFAFEAGEVLNHPDMGKAGRIEGRLASAPSSEASVTVSLDEKSHIKTSNGAPRTRSNGKTGTSNTPVPRRGAPRGRTVAARYTGSK